MIHCEPDKRLEAEDYLKQQRGNAFPEIVYTFLQPYMAGPVCQRNISFCRWAYSGYKEGFGQHHSQSLWTRSAGESRWRAQGEWAGYLGVSYNILPADPEILWLQACRFGTYSPFGPRIKSVEILLDRITPYLLHFSNDSVPRVRAEALRTLTKVLALVKEVPRNDVNIYPEYILPGIAHLAQDDATIVRLAYPGKSLLSQ